MKHQQTQDNFFNPVVRRSGPQLLGLKIVEIPMVNPVYQVQNRKQKQGQVMSLPKVTAESSVCFTFQQLEQNFDSSVVGENLSH